MKALSEVQFVTRGWPTAAPSQNSTGSLLGVLVQCAGWNICDPSYRSGLHFEHYVIYRGYIAGDNSVAVCFRRECKWLAAL